MGHDSQHQPAQATQSQAPQAQGRAAARLDNVPNSIFTAMSSLALQTGAINLGQGFPDVEGPEGVLEAAERALRGGRNQYAPGIGAPDLRAAIARQRGRDYGLDLNPDTEVVVTAGATEAIAAAILGLVNHGDEVAVIEPYYDSYVACLDMAGARRRPVALVQRDGRFCLDRDAVTAAVTHQTKAIVMNTPHNPTGAVFDDEELAFIAELACRHDVLVIVDEAYEALTFDGLAHHPIATLPGMWSRTLSLSSAGKMFALTGWKVGWATGPADLVAATMAAKQWLTFTNAAPLQPAIAHGLDHEHEFVAEQAQRLQAQRDQLCEGLRAAGLDPVVPQGTYFTVTDVAHLGWADGMAFASALPQRAGVVAVPTQGFYDDPQISNRTLHQVRWAFCKKPDVLDKALTKLSTADLTAP